MYDGKDSSPKALTLFALQFCVYNLNMIMQVAGFESRTCAHLLVKSLNKFCQWIEYRMESTSVLSTGQKLLLLIQILTLKVTANSVFSFHVTNFAIL